MPTLSERQTLIRAILLATEEETEQYFASLEHGMSFSTTTRLTNSPQRTRPP